MFYKNNICCHAGGEDNGCIMCCYGGIPEHVEPENCGENVCEWYSKLKKYTITAKAEDITECQITLNDEQLQTILSVFKELDRNRESDFCPWYEVQDEDGNMIYETECI